MRLLLTILLFSTALNAQVPFKLGTAYPKSWVVEYPPNSKTYWQASKAITANDYPAEGNGWKQFFYPGTSTPTPVPVVVPELVNKSEFDSLLNVISGLTKRLKTIEDKPADTALTTYKISLYGASMFRVVDPKTFMIKSLVESPTIGFTWTDSTIVPYLKEVKKVAAVKPSIIATKKATVKK